ncbi:type II toxin-antitoxin system HicB family antitoxin [Prosthecobacter sp.]|uniref:type II toxin-antitoxin system HicB family antitoxin n=1 Tax=Prosthecobacter sp. TaxID=1965333 RepID=UPI003782EB8F
MSFTAVYEPAPEGGFTCWVEEIPAAISEGETIEEAESNLMEALKLVLECQRELSDQTRSPGSLKRSLELAAA